MRTANEKVNGLIVSIGFVYAGMCACPGRVRKFTWYMNKTKLEIKHHQSARFVQLYCGKVVKIYSTYADIEKFIQNAKEIQRAIETGTP